MEITAAKIFSTMVLMENQMVNEYEIPSEDSQDKPVWINATENIILNPDPEFPWPEDITWAHTAYELNYHHPDHGWGEGHGMLLIANTKLQFWRFAYCTPAFMHLEVEIENGKETGRKAILPL